MSPLTPQRHPLATGRSSAYPRYAAEYEELQLAVRHFSVELCASGLGPKDNCLCLISMDEFVGKHIIQKKVNINKHQ
jgi:hypothetical protein